MSKLQWCPHIANIDEALLILAAKHKRLLFEQAYLEFPDGRIARVQGGLNHVTPNKDINMTNVHMIHNHFSDGSPLSLESIGLSGMDVGYAMVKNMKSMTAIDERTIIKITRPKEGWTTPHSTMIFIPNRTKWNDFGEVKVWKTESI